MTNDLKEVAYFVEMWDATGEVVPTPIAHTLAEYWAANGSNGALAALARGKYPEYIDLYDDIMETFQRAKMGGHDDVLKELAALLAWQVANRHLMERN